MARRRILLPVLLGVLTLTACGTATSADPSSGDALHGIAMDGSTCPTTVPVGPVVSVRPSQVTALTICAQPQVSTSRSVTVTRGDPRFDGLSAALAAADRPSASGVACPLYANLRQDVIARVGSGSVYVRIPLDGCGHYQQAVTAALARVRPL